MRSFIIVPLLLFLLSCQEQKPIHIKGKTMGTTYNVKIYSQEKLDSSSLKNDLDTMLKKLNMEMSTYISDSEISYFNKFDRLGDIKVSKDFFDVAKYSLSLARKTQGIYDPTIGPLVNLWGFGPDGKRKVPSDSDLVAARALVGFDKVILNDEKLTLSKKVPGVYLDLSSSAKGFGVDKLTRYLESKNLKNFMVEIGGEIRVKGVKPSKKPWSIAIEAPSLQNKEITQRVLKLSNVAVATSGNYRNFFMSGGKKYSHTIHPRTGKPVENFIVSVSVLHQEGCMQADALATALMAMGFDSARKYIEKEQIAAYIIHRTREGQGVQTFSSQAFSKYTSSQL